MAGHKENTRPTTLDQRRARHAWEAVRRVADRGEAGDTYGREAKRLPVRIMQAGLGHSLAFLRAKGGEGNTALLKDLADWILWKRGTADGSGARPRDDALIKAIVEGDADFLRWATEETMAYLQWLNRFAEAELKTDED